MVQTARPGQSSPEFPSPSRSRGVSRRKSLIRWQKRAAVWEHGLESRWGHHFGVVEFFRERFPGCNGMEPPLSRRRRERDPRLPMGEPPIRSPASAGGRSHSESCDRHRCVGGIPSVLAPSRRRSDELWQQHYRCVSPGRRLHRQDPQGRHDGWIMLIEETVPMSRMLGRTPAAKPAASCFSRRFHRASAGQAGPHRVRDGALGVEEAFSKFRIG
jgi:hypothetical protein